MLWMMFQGSKPIAASTTPTRIDSRISRNATASGEPPRKRYRPSLWPAGKSLTSLGISLSWRSRRTIGHGRAHGEPVGTSQWPPCTAKTLTYCHGLQHPLQRLQPVGLARRLVPAQAIDARKPHRDAGFVPRRARQSLEGDFQHQPLIRFMHDVPDGPEFFRGIAADETGELQQFLARETRI